jgi:hypothetical protein
MCGLDMGSMLDEEDNQHLNFRCRVWDLLGFMNPPPQIGDGIFCWWRFLIPALVYLDTYVNIPILRAQYPEFFQGIGS